MSGYDFQMKSAEWTVKTKITISQMNMDAPMLYSPSDRDARRNLNTSSLMLSLDRRLTWIVCLPSKVTLECAHDRQNNVFSPMSSHHLHANR